MSPDPHCRIGRVRPKPIEIDPAGHRAGQIRRILGRTVREAIHSMGDEFASFALVAWTMRGEAFTATGPDIGPIGESLIPTYCRDALSRQIGVSLTERTGTYPVSGR